MYPKVQDNVFVHIPKVSKKSSYILEISVVDKKDIWPFYTDPISVSTTEPEKFEMKKRKRPRISPIEAHKESDNQSPTFISEHMNVNNELDQGFYQESNQDNEFEVFPDLDYESNANSIPVTQVIENGPIDYFCRNIFPPPDSQPQRVGCDCDQFLLTVADSIRNHIATLQSARK